MNYAKKTTLWSALTFGLATLIGCQQPYRCGARDEPCCNFEGVAPCIGELGLSCNAGLCTGGARTACPAPDVTCDVGLQNCPAGQSCQTSGSATLCTPAGAGTEGASCVNEQQCAPGYYCSTAGNVCRRYCCGDTGCSAGQECLSLGIESSRAGLCITSCDPITQSPCVNSSCYPLVFDEVITFFCLVTGSVPVGGSCGSATATCVGGAACFGDRCREMCRPSNPVCSSGACTSVDGADDFGACL